MLDFDSVSQEDRKFLHDFAIPLCILRLTLKKISKPNGDATQIRDQEYLQKALQAISQLEELHGNFKKKISQRELIHLQSKKSPEEA